MKVVMISDMEDFGGAAASTGRLADGLCARGHEVIRVLGTRSPTGTRSWVPRSLHRSERQTLLQKAGRQMLPRRFRPGLDRGRVEAWLDCTLSELRPDVVSVHSLHMQATSGWSVGMVGVAARHAPVAWRLHDQWSFTGRCAYSFDCRLFTTGCDERCPTPDEYPQLAPRLIAPAWEERRRLLGSCPNVVAVAQSQWMASMARDGLWRGHRIEVVPNGLPLDVWRPGDRHAARAELGVGEGDVLIAASAGDWSARYKGGPVLIEALRRVSDPTLTLIILGESRALPDLSGLRVLRPGFVKDPLRCASLLSAADLFVHPALVDNFPNSVLEGIACGVPVVAFRVGGLPDMVRPGISGWLAARPDAQSLADCLTNAIAAVRGGLSLRESCRALAAREYSVEAIARSYEAVLGSLGRPGSGDSGGRTAP